MMTYSIQVHFIVAAPARDVNAGFGREDGVTAGSLGTTSAGGRNGESCSDQKLENLEKLINLAK